MMAHMKAFSSMITMVDTKNSKKLEIYLNFINLNFKPS